MSLFGRRTRKCRGPTLCHFRAHFDQHLISWKQSIQFELSAHNVLCITPNLKWATSRLDKSIIPNTKRMPKKTYRYIVFNNGVPENVKLAKENAEKIKQVIAADESLAKQLQVGFLTARGSHSKAADHIPAVADWMYLPFPTDIVVYDEVEALRGDSGRPTTFAVMSLTPIDAWTEDSLIRDIEPLVAGMLSSDLVDDDEDELRYDLQLLSEDHYKPIQDWFTTHWKKHVVRLWE